jgi:hypothetical protein
VAGGGGTYRPFDRTVAQVKEADVKARLIGWDRSLKTKAPDPFRNRATARTQQETRSRRASPD